MSERYKILVGDPRDRLAELEPDSVHVVPTSPPYWSMRDYGFPDQIGLEPEFTCWGWAAHLRRLRMRQIARHKLEAGVAADPARVRRWLEGSPGEIDEYLCLDDPSTPWLCHTCVMIQVFREVRRVLHPSGSVWLNYGDRFNQYLANHRSTNWEAGVPRPRYAAGSGLLDPTRKNRDRLLMPHIVALALQADGWRVYQDVVWHKPNAKPDSQGARPSSSKEYVFLLTKRERGVFYDADAVRTPYKTASVKRFEAGRDSTGQRHGRHQPGAKANGKNKPQVEMNIGALLRDVWTIASTPFYGDHTATYPVALPERCILAGSSKHGACPKCRAPWTRIVEKGAADLEAQRAAGADRDGGYSGRSLKDYGAALAEEPGKAKASMLRSYVEHITMGWEPTCECEGHFEKREIPDPEGETKTIKVYVPDGEVSEPEPSRVLDFFAGAFTTGVAALKHGRHAVLIEGSESGAAEGRERIERELRQWEHVRARSEHDHKLMAGQGQLF